MSLDTEHIHSLDPRVTRLHIEAEAEQEQKPQLDQLETYEVFHQQKEGKAFTYAGPVHGANEEIAFLFGKEQYSRRAACTGMWIVKTQRVFVTPYVDDNTSFYDTLQELTAKPEDAEQTYEIFHLKKRGKAHAHAGTVSARSYEHALQVAKQTLNTPPVVNVWVVASQDVLREEQEKDIWLTTPEKKYREATAYRVQDKIDRFKAERQAQ
ncbi:phenylacetic acid degradation b [Rufibacter sp. DG15C]|uniref:phenylacetic acid degradation b n=1 Tax=Rufibacter sp. DG15C TaxID=1379909 RepID=UPI00078E3A30|nr:phenylacetic acid degradation b [Rufibacter sp. DG15C]AMM49983.1 phenylacetic acid degradation b [Rufibacter sp. DG15C]